MASIEGVAEFRAMGEPDPALPIPRRIGYRDFRGAGLPVLTGSAGHRDRIRDGDAWGGGQDPPSESGQEWS